ncbi:MAG: heavy metal-associated domain-containing protein [Lachnospiraceae bacterium]|nr:heavy metal-associated domain-containing protein [Lachnospiraceae bacterium]MDY5742118.1 heavy metal-associated domain-containing protein [Lachnospiraceae bacterium]
MKKVIKLENLDCANCAAKMEERISRLPGVEKANVSFMLGKLVLYADEAAVADILIRAEKIIHDLEPGVIIHA